MTDKKSYRVVLGERLKAFREERGLSAYRVAKDGGISIGQVKIVEQGDTNYTMDVFLGYMAGARLYMYFAEKRDGGRETHDFAELARKAIDNDPHK